MGTQASPERSVRVGAFIANLRSGEVRKNGRRILLADQPFKVLAFLLRQPGQVVTREELRAELWPQNTFVDFEHGLTSAVARLRASLNDSAERPAYIETLGGRGYRLIAPVQDFDQERGSEAHVPAAVAVPPINRLTPGASISAGKLARLLSSNRIVSLIFPVAIGLLAIAGIIAVLFALTVHGWRDRLFVHAAKPRIQSLAVLPLANLSGDPEQEYFADGMTEALITELGKTNIPRVISRQSVMQYKGSKKPLQEIARELNVDAVLEGTVVRSGNRVRVTVHLNRASPEGQLWASAYDRSVRDILDLQNEIASTVTHEIRVKLTPQKRADVAGARPVDPEAHDDYLRGRYILAMATAAHWSSGPVARFSRFADKRQYTGADILAAIGYFKHAIEKNPAYAMPYAGLADAYIQLGNPVWGGHSPKKTLAEAKEEATKALDLDPSLAEAHFALAQVLQYDWNWSEAENEYKLALKLNPNFADAHLEHGRFVQAMGRNDEALREMNCAMEVDPFGVRTKVVVAWVTWASRQYDIALKQFESLGDDFGLIYVYRAKGMYPEALAAWERWKVHHPAQVRYPFLLATLGGIYALQGRKHEAEELIGELKEIAKHQYVSGSFFAEVYVGLGQKDQAINWLEQAYEDHDQGMVFVAAYPGLDPLHSEPRFQALLRRMNFPK